MWTSQQTQTRVTLNSAQISTARQFPTRFKHLKQVGETLKHEVSDAVAAPWNRLKTFASEAARSATDALLTKTQGYPRLHQLIKRIRDDAAFGKKIILAVIAFGPFDE